MSNDSRRCGLMGYCEHGIAVIDNRPVDQRKPLERPKLSEADLQAKIEAEEFVRQHLKN